MECASGPPIDMRCVLCDGRKGKRFCPAKNALICPQCCGEKRILEIDCPETCEYLKTGRVHETSQETQRWFRTSDPVKIQKYRRVMKEFEPFVSHLEYLLAAARRSSRDLRDQDAAEALDLILSTLRTEESGLIYERASSDLRVDSLRREIWDLTK